MAIIDKVYRVNQVDKMYPMQQVGVVYLCRKLVINALPYFLCGEQPKQIQNLGHLTVLPGLKIHSILVNKLICIFLEAPRISS